MDSKDVKDRIETLENKLKSKVKNFINIITNNRLTLIMIKLIKK